MTDQPGAIPMGVGVENRAGPRPAVLRHGVIACPVHTDGVVTANGSLYRCDYNHLLHPPVDSDGGAGDTANEPH